MTDCPHEASARDAFVELLGLAAADRSTTQSEAVLLEEFRQHLGISARKARAYRRTAHRLQKTIPSTERARVDQLAMLLRVAWSDGRLCESERQYLEQLALVYELPRPTLARLMQEAQDRFRHRRRQTRGLALVGVVALGAILTAVIATWSDGDQAIADEMLAFKELEARYSSSILLLHCSYLLRHADGGARRSSHSGTGFFVSADGLVATSKHVVQPWKFPSGSVEELMRQGWVPDESSLRVLAWTAGSSFRRPDGELRVDEAYSTEKGSLRLAAVAPDVFRAVVSGQAPRHAQDSNDLALLHCQVPAPVRPLPLGGRKEVHALDPVMVMGFPQGSKLLEGDVATCSPVLGRVRKVEESIYITAPIVGGNSGGPLIDRHGEVIGIATRLGGGYATLGCCIRSRHLEALLD